MDPRFSVIIPTYNRASTLIRSIRSVLDQTVPAWEIIVVDDGSSDNTWELVAKFPQVRYHYQVNSGVCAARNQGAEIATGDWLIFLDSDDELVNTALERICNFIFINNDNFNLIKGGYRRIKSNEMKDFIPTENLSQSFLSGSFAVKKILFDQVGGYDDKLVFSENAEFHHRVLLSDRSIGYLGSVSLIYYESIGGGSKNIRNMIDSLTLILEKHDETLTPHVKHLYHQIIGVNWIRFRNFSKARHHLFQALKYKPTKLSTWCRLFLSCFPLVARRLYKESVNHG